MWKIHKEKFESPQKRGVRGTIKRMSYGITSFPVGYVFDKGYLFEGPSSREKMY